MASGATSSLTTLMRLASRVICLIVIAWFVVFVVDQTGSASVHQQNEVTEGSAPAPSTPDAKHESALHRTLNETTDALTSPFAGVVSGSHSEWTIHIVKTILALLVYGFGLAFLARFLRVRA
jgi:predicted secreted protein